MAVQSAAEEQLCRRGRETVAGAAGPEVAGGGGSGSRRLGKTRAHGHCGSGGEGEEK